MRACDVTHVVSLVTNNQAQEFMRVENSHVNLDF